MPAAKKKKKKKATRTPAKAAKQSASTRKKSAPAGKKSARSKTAKPARSAAVRAKKGGQKPAAEGRGMPLDIRKRRQLLAAILLRKRNQVVQGLEAQMGKKLVYDASQRVDSAMDSADQSAQDVEQGIDFSLLEMKYEQFKDIAEAFRKLESNAYGVCEECGEEIDIKRLEVNPLARYCFNCKSRRESLEKVGREETRFKE